jgi:hypothetical protein
MHSMKKMTPQQAERWAKIRAKGRNRFVRLVGVVGWGLPVAVLWSLTMAAIQGWDRIWLYLPIALVGFPVAGYWFGSTLWRKVEVLYQQSITELEEF